MHCGVGWVPMRHFGFLVLHNFGVLGGLVWWFWWFDVKN
jgi:hypothetical protein